jgi:hypothetical protein
MYELLIIIMFALFILYCNHDKSIEFFKKDIPEPLTITTNNNVKNEINDKKYLHNYFHFKENINKISSDYLENNYEKINMLMKNKLNVSKYKYMKDLYDDLT